MNDQHPRPTTGPTRKNTGGIPDGLLLGGLALLLGLTVLTWTATGLAALLAHGTWPDGVTFTETPGAIRSLASAPHDLPAAWPGAPAGQLPGYGLFWGILISQALVLVVLTVFVLGTVTRARAVRTRRRDLRKREPEQRNGDAPAPRDGDVPAPRDGGTQTPEPAGPAPETPPAAEALTKNTTVTTPAPTPVPAPAPPAADDARTRLLEAPGAAVVTSPDPHLWETTKDARAALGPVHIFDPTHQCDTPHRLRWSPHHGCAVHDTAAARARDLLAPLDTPAGTTGADIRTTAETLLRCWLHAAALARRPFRDVHRWTQAAASTEPVQTLRTHPKAGPGTAGELEAVLTGHPERRHDATALIQQALAPMSQLHVRNACSASRADRVALDSFAAETGTLYIVGNDPDVQPLLHALTRSVTTPGTPGGGLTPALTEIDTRGG